MNFYQGVLHVMRLQDEVFQDGESDYDDNVDDLEPGDYEDDLGDYVERQEEYVDKDNMDFFQG